MNFSSSTCHPHFFLYTICMTLLKNLGQAEKLVGKIWATVWKEKRSQRQSKSQSFQWIGPKAEECENRVHFCTIYKKNSIVKLWIIEALKEAKNKLNRKMHGRMHNSEKCISAANKATKFYFKLSCHISFKLAHCSCMPTNKALSIGLAIAILYCLWIQRDIRPTEM